MTKRLLLLNGLAALMITFHHAAAFTYSAMFDWADRYRAVSVPNYDMIGSFPYYVMLVVRQLDSFAIPAFLFVSGFFVAFMARGKHSEIRLAMITPRIKVLLVPFLIWTAVRFSLLQQIPRSVLDILNMYYYIPLIIELYLLSPILVPLAKRNWKWLLIGVAVLQLSAESLRYLNAIGVTFPGMKELIAATPLWFFPRRIFYFAIGIVFSTHIQSVHQWLPRVKWHLLALMIGSAVLTVVEHELVAYLIGQPWVGRTFDGVTRLIYAATFSLCFLAFYETPLPYSKKLAELGIRSLGIYLMNTPVVFVAATLMYHFTPWLLGIHLLYFAILAILGLAVPLFVMEVVRKTPAKVVYRYAFG